MLHVSCWANRAFHVVGFAIVLVFWLGTVLPDYAFGYQDVNAKPVEKVPAEVAAAPKSKKVKPLVAKKWIKKIQAIGAEYEKGDTQAQADLARSQLVESIAKSLDGSAIKIRTKIKEVSWEKGFANVLTEREYDSKVGKQTPLRITRNTPIEIKMTQVEAAAIVPGQRLEFNGQLKFYPRRWGAVGKATSSQQMYALRHEYLGGGYLGTFTSTNFECFIDGKKVQPRWAAISSKDDAQK